MSDPLVSIVMAVKNAEKYLEEALESIAKQTYPNYEIILIDGNSADSTEKIARSFEVNHFQKQIGSGFADAWNQGIEIAQGEFIALLDSDDRWKAEKLAKQVEFLDNNPTYPLVIARVQFFMDAEQKSPKGFNPKLLESDHIAYMPGVLLTRRSFFDEIGKFDTELRIANDIAWFASLNDHKIPVGLVDEVLIYKRVHQSNLSYVTDITLFHTEVLKLLRESIMQRRNQK